MTAPTFPPAVWPASWRRSSAVPLDVWPTPLDPSQTLIVRAEELMPRVAARRAQTVTLRLPN